MRNLYRLLWGLTNLCFGFHRCAYLLHWFAIHFLWFSSTFINSNWCSMDLTHLLPQRALGKSGEVWGAPGSGEVRGGLESSGQVRGVWRALDRSGEVWGGPGRSWGVWGGPGSPVGSWAPRPPQNIRIWQQKAKKAKKAKQYCENHCKLQWI